jgi:hypothetical protein
VVGLCTSTNPAITRGISTFILENFDAKSLLLLYIVMMCIEDGEKYRGRGM